MGTIYSASWTLVDKGGTRESDIQLFDETKTCFILNNRKSFHMPIRLSCLRLSCLYESTCDFCERLIKHKALQILERLCISPISD